MGGVGFDGTPEGAQDVRLPRDANHYLLAHSKRVDDLSITDLWVILANDIALTFVLPMNNIGLTLDLHNTVPEARSK